MGKWYGKIGYIITCESEEAPGIYEEHIVEHEYYGDVIKLSKKNESSGNVIDNINVSNSISIVADLFAHNNFHAMKYITFMGSKWKISSVDVQYPRLVLTIGGLYNE